MEKYRGVVLLPLTVKGTGVNPIGYPLMVFNSDPNLSIGERRILRCEELEKHLDFNALVVNRSEHQEGDTRVIAYLFEVEDRSLALRIAELVRIQNPEVFEENNLG